MELKQKRGEKRKEFKLVDDELFIKERGLIATKEWSVYVENIAHHKTIVKHSRKRLNFLGIVFISISIIVWFAAYFQGNPNGEMDGFIWGGIFMLFLGIVALKAPMDDTLSIETIENRKLVFYLDSPSRQEVEDFASKLIEKSKQKLIEKYSRIDPDIPENVFMERLDWLLNSNLISLDFYDKKKQDDKMNNLIKN